MTVMIKAIQSSPEHHYFTRKKFEIGDAPTTEHQEVLLEAGKGISGDRFERGKFPLTFISDEVIEEVCSRLDLPYNSLLFRRNIVIRGINLNQLIGKRFRIGEVEFEGMEHCAPCTWMNAVMKKGAYALMRGRGGLRAKVIRGGLLKTGPNTLLVDGDFISIDPLEPLSRPSLP